MTWQEELKAEGKASRARYLALSEPERAAIARELDSEADAAEGDPRLYVGP
mgnify:CR=1 FL=1